MELIDRYIYEVGRHLPRKDRSDIQIELRSLLVDALEERAAGEPTEAEIVALLQEFGSPKKVAASYYPEGQYLIGPALYPLFRLVTGIVLAAVTGAQILAWAVAYFIAQQPFTPVQALTGLLNSLPASLGMVVIVFAILQRLEVRPETEEAPWDPHDLPHVQDVEPIKRGERIFEIVFSIVILVVLIFLPERVGFVSTPGGRFFANPVIPQYIGWITIVLLAGIGLDIYLLWQGRWQASTRIAKIAVNLLSIFILFLLVQGHTAWLAEQGAAGLFTGLERLPEDIASGGQLIGMHAYRMAFGVALIVMVIDTLALVYRLVRAGLQRDLTPVALPARKA